MQAMNIQKRIWCKTQIMIIKRTYCNYEVQQGDIPGIQQCLAALKL